LVDADACPVKEIIVRLAKERSFTEATQANEVLFSKIPKWQYKETNSGFAGG